MLDKVKSLGRQWIKWFKNAGEKFQYTMRTMTGTGQWTSAGNLRSVALLVTSNHAAQFEIDSRKIGKIHYGSTNAGQRMDKGQLDGLRMDKSLESDK
jgi:hypothetical protein